MRVTRQILGIVVIPRAPTSIATVSVAVIPAVRVITVPSPPPITLSVAVIISVSVLWMPAVILFLHVSTSATTFAAAGRRVPIAESVIVHRLIMACSRIYDIVIRPPER